MIKKIINVFLVILLIIGLIGLVLVYSISKEVNEKSINNIINQTINSGAEDRGISYSESYDTLIKDCEGKENIIIGEGENILKINCLELKSIGRDNFENYFKKKVTREAQAKFGVNYDLIKYWLLIFGIASLILTFGIVALDIKRTFVNLGIAGVVSGIPFIVSGITKKTMENILKGKILEAGGSLDSFPGIIDLINNVTNRMFDNFLVIFGIGVLFLVIGFTIIVFKKIKKNKEGHKK